MRKDISEDKKYRIELLQLMVGKTKKLLKKGKTREEIATTLHITLTDADELIGICTRAEANRQRHANK